MLSFLLIGGLVWLVLALAFVAALAAAARPQSSPSPLVDTVEVKTPRTERVEDTISDEDGLSESPVPT